MNYPEQIIDNYKRKYANIQTALQATPLFPNTSSTKPNCFLDERMELILKVTFKLRVVFLEEMEFILAFVSSKATTEAMVLELEKQGYIKSALSRDLGKYWILTQQALYYFYTDRSISFKDVTLPTVSLPSESKLMPLKCANAIVSTRVFDTMTYALYDSYKHNDKAFKQHYQKAQFVEQFILKDSQKKLSASEKEIVVNDYLKTNDLSKESNKQYANFIKFFKDEATTIHLFNYLKAYLSSEAAQPFKKEAIGMTFSLLSDHPTNLYKDNSLTFRNNLWDWCKHSERIANETKLYLIEEYLKQFSIAKRSLNNIKLENKSPEEVARVNKNIQELDAILLKYEAHKKKLTEDFQVMLYDKIGENNLPLYTEQRVTLESLKASNIYITDATLQDNGKMLVTFSILQPSFEEFSVSYLFGKLEKIFQYAIKNLLMVDYCINIITYDRTNADIATRKLPTLKEDFSSVAQYALFLINLSQVKVIPMEHHFKERFEIFREISKEL